MKPKTLVTLATAGITLFGMGFWYGSDLSFKREESKSLEQTVASAPVEPIPPVKEVCNIGLSDEEKELTFYAGALEVLDIVHWELFYFNENLKSYTSQKENNSKLLYLGQAKENMNSIYRNLFLLQRKTKFAPFVSQKFVQTLYNMQYSHSQFMQEYLDELKGVFTEEGNADINVNKFSSEKNKDMDDFNRELTSAMKQAERKIEER